MLLAVGEEFYNLALALLAFRALLDRNRDYEEKRNREIPY